MDAPRAMLELDPPFGALDRQIWLARLARTVSHQLASPLTALAVTAEYLLQQLPADAPAHADALEILRAAQRCSGVLESFSALARRGRGPQLEAVDLRQTVAELVPLLEHALMISRVALQAELPADLRPVRGHRADVEHVLVRLLFGAMDAARPGAPVVLAARDEGAQIALEVGCDGRAGAGAGSVPLLDRVGQAACAELVAALGGTLELAAGGPGRCAARLRLPAWCEGGTG